MKKVLKITGFIVLAIIAILVIGAGYISISGVPDYTYAPTPEIENLKIPRGDTMLIARGRKIASLLCKQCHIGSDGKLSGSLREDIPAMLGTVASLNITRDPVHGIGNWTDGEIYYFLRTGIHKDGRWSPPFMPSFARVADNDLQAIIAWLRSDDPTLAPSQKEYPPNQWNFLVKLLGHTVFSPADLPSGPILIPDSTDRVAFGRYLADDLIGCYSCHSADLTKINDKIPAKSLGYYGGGAPLLNLEGETVNSANITMDEKTGIGNITEQEFVDAVRFCKKPGGGILAYPMGPHPTLTDDEVKAIYQFIQTVPKIENPVDRYKGPTGN